MASQKRHQKLEVLWEDAWSSNGHWTTKRVKEEGPYLLESTGYLIHRDAKRIVLARERQPNVEGDYRDIWSVPMSLVRRVRVVK